MTAFQIRHDKSIVGSPALHMSSLAVILFAFWLLLSGNTEIKFLTYGVLTSLITAWITYPLLLIPNETGTRKYFLLGVNPLKLVFYLFWLFWQLVLANLDVLRATVRPEIEIDPRVVRFRYQADHPMAKVCLANSITLTPRDCHHRRGRGRRLHRSRPHRRIRQRTQGRRHAEKSCLALRNAIYL